MNPSNVVVERPSTQIDLRLVILLGALGAFAPLSLDTPVPALPTLGRYFGVGTIEIQLTVSACLLGLAFGQILAGPLSDAFGRKRPILAGVALYALVSFLCAIAPSAGALIGLRFVQGIAGAFAIVVSSAVVRDLYSGVTAARFFSLMLLVTGIVPVLAPIIGGQLLGVASWQAIFLMLAMISALILLLITRSLPETLPAEARRKGGVGATMQTFRQLLNDRGFVGYALAFGLALGALSAYASGATFVLQQMFAVSPQNVSLVYSMNSLGFMLVGQLNGYLVSRVPPRRLLVIGLTGMTLGGLMFLFAILTSAGLNVMLPALFVLVASMGFIMPNMMTLALAAYPQSAGSAAALLGFMPFACGTITAPLAGIGGATTAFPMALTIVVCATGALMLSVFATQPRGIAAGG